MEAEKLKMILDALANTTVAAREAFYVYLASQVLVDLIVAGTVIWIIWFIANRIVGVLKWHQHQSSLFLTLYNRLVPMSNSGTRDDASVEPGVDYIGDRDVQNLIARLEHKIMNAKPHGDSPSKL